MFGKSWINKVWSPLGVYSQRRRCGHRATAKQPRQRLALEILEDRLAPAILTVNSLADNITDISVLTLRDAIGLVNNVGDPSGLGQESMPDGWSAQIAGSFGDNDTIQFDSSLIEATPQTIILGGSELLLSRSMTLTGPGASRLAVSGNQASSVFDIAGGTTVGISGLTIENGKATLGGGIFNDGTLTLSDSIVSGNFVTYVGGGIYNSGSATISGTTLSGNMSAGGFSSGGGAITNDGDLTLIGSVLSDNSAYDGGAIQNYATMTITGTTFSRNHGQRGGAIYNRYDALTISESALSDNSAVFGGAIYNESTLTVSGSTLSRNSATSSGGAIQNVATMTVNRSTLSRNSTKSGGGIYNDGTLTVSGSTLSDNSSDIGGGIYNSRGAVNVSASTLSHNSAKIYYGGGIYNFDRGAVAVSNSTLAANSATYGGGIYNPYGTLTLSNSTLSGNSAKTDGGGIYNGFVDFPGVFVRYTATLTVESSIVAGNSGNAISSDLYQNSGLPTKTLTVTDSLVGDNSGTLLDEAPVGAPDANGNFIGTPAATINPRLGPLADNGGPTQTMALLAGSLALDQGANPDNLATDQRGVLFVRRFGSQIDMGAYEVNANQADLQVTVSAVTPNPLLKGQEFSYIITVTNTGPRTATKVIIEDVKKNPISALGDLKSGESVNFVVKKTAEAAGTYDDTIFAHADQLDPNLTDNIVIAKFQVIAPQADLQVTISPVTPNPVLEGQEFSYTITVTNLAEQAATNVVLVFVSTDGATNAIFAPGTLKNGEQAFFLVTKTAGTAGTYRDTYFAFADQEDPNPANDIATVEFTAIAPQADLQVTSSPVAPNPMLEGQEFSYTITVANVGPQTATNVVVHDAQKNVIFTPGEIPSGETATFLVKKTAGAPGTYSDTIIANAGEQDLNPADNAYVVKYRVDAPQIDLQVTVSAITPSLLFAGQAYFYTITLTNLGPQTATNVIVEDAKRNLVFAPKSLPKDGHVSFLVKKTAGEAGTYKDIIFARADEQDPNPADNTATVIATVLPFSTPNLQDLVDHSLNSGVPVALNADPSQVGNIVDAVNGLKKPNAPVIITVNLAAGTVPDITASPPMGVTLVINGNGKSTTVVGNSPALTVASGMVIVNGLTFTTASESPTILVTGGHLVLRNDIVQESTGRAAAAIAVTGGTLDLGTVADPGGNTLNVNGAGILIRNASPEAVSAIGNTFQVDGTKLTLNFRIEDRIAHALDAASMGLVTWVADNVYVTPSSGSVQRGIDSVALGGTVNVETANHALFNVGARLVTVNYLNGPSLGLEADALHPGHVMLHVVGTTGDDTIRIKSVDDELRVRIKDQDMGYLKLRGAFDAAIGRIVVSGLAGDDDIVVDDDIAISAWLSGNDGNDRLKGGDGNDVLLGGAGDDLLVGGNGSDLMIGGIGADRLHGNAGEDLLIAGYTAHDANDFALWSIMQEWTSRLGYNARVANIQAGAGVTSGFWLNGNDGTLQTVFNDNDVDTLTGNQGMDWILANKVADNGGALDKFTDQAGNELWSDTDS